MCKKCTVVFPSAHAQVQHISCVHMYNSIHMWAHTNADFLKVCMLIHINMDKCEHTHVQTLSVCNVVCTFLVCMNLGTGAHIYMLMCTSMPV